MFPLEFIKIFLSREFICFEQSQLEFRKQALKTLQIFLNIYIIIFMVIYFPFIDVSLGYYIILPSFLVLNNILIWIINRKHKHFLCTRYLFLLQLLIQTVGLELAVTSFSSFSPKRALLIGVLYGITQTIGFLNISSSLLKFISSAIWFIQMILRFVVFEEENLYRCLAAIASVLFLVNFLYYRCEMLNFSLWRSNSAGLLHFQKLIDIFPNQMVVINKSSFDEDRALYMNKEAEIMINNTFKGRNKSFKAFLDYFLVEQKYPLCNQHMYPEPTLKDESLMDFTYRLITQANFDDEFKKITAVFDRLKWEVEYGWIEWNKEKSLIIILNDISKNEKINVLEKLDKNKDKFLATISHELRTPLNSVVGMIDVCFEEIPEHFEAIRNYLRIAKESANSLSLMINNIIDMELIRKGKLTLTLKKSLLSETIDNILPLSQFLARKKNLEFIYLNECAAKTFVYVDPIRFQQILMNLLENAIKFTSQGFIKLSIKTTKGENFKASNLFLRGKNKRNLTEFRKSIREKETNFEDFYSADDIEFYKNGSLNNQEVEQFIKIIVEDSGIGVPEEEQKSLFKSFGRVGDNQTVRGMGLGLAISQSLALKMGSTGINLRSADGKGSKFYFKIKTYSKVKISSHSKKIPDEDRKPIFIKEFPLTGGVFEARTEKKKFNILVVDDDDVNQLVISLYLKSFLHLISYQKAFNGKEALDIVNKSAENNFHFDLILMDCDMPVMNGFQATSKLNEKIKHGKLPKAKIIALTANASISNKECCIKNGMLDVWHKPINKRDFFRKLKCILPKEIADKILY